MWPKKQPFNNLLEKGWTKIIPDGGKGSSEVGSSWVGSSEAGSSEAGSSEAGSSEAGSSEAGSSEAGSSWAGSSEAGSSWAGSSEAGSSEAGSSEAGSSEAGSSEAGWTWNNCKFIKRTFYKFLAQPFSKRLLKGGVELRNLPRSFIRIVGLANIRIKQEGLYFFVAQSFFFIFILYCIRIIFF